MIKNTDNRIVIFYLSFYHINFFYSNIKINNFYFIPKGIFL